MSNNNKKCPLGGYFFNFLGEKCGVFKDIPEANYCDKHGCRVCNYVNPKSIYNDKKGRAKVTARLREEGKTEQVCSGDCVTRLENKIQQEIEKEEEEIKNHAVSFFKEKNKELRMELSTYYASFYKNVKDVDLTEIKIKFVEKKLTVEDFISESHNLIEKSSLSEDDKKKWKEIYQESNLKFKLASFFYIEKNLLLSLAKHEQKEQNEKEEIIKEINQLLSIYSPQVDIRELPVTFHNFEDLKTQELKDIKNNIIEAIKNKREEKKLLAFLDKAASCVDNELYHFITELEKFASAHASQYEKNAYMLQKNKVDEVIANLRKRWNDLGQDAKLDLLRRNACDNFDRWIKEGENLVLSDDCPFRDFKERIKNFSSEAEIESQQRQAFQHVIEKFKKNVKEELGVEMYDKEYQDIDKSKDFAQVKLVRENIKQERKYSLKEFKERAIVKLQNLLDSNQEVDLSEIILPTWKESLNDLKDKREVNSFAKNMEEEINNALIRRDKPQNPEKTKKEVANFIFSYKEISVISGLVVILAILILGAVKIKNICLSLVSFSE